MPEHPFRKLIHGSYRERLRVQYEEQYEESRVSFLLKKVGCPANHVRVLRRKNEEETRVSRLTFSLFNREYPSFPVLLGSTTLDGTKLHTDKRAMIPSLFKAFAGSPFVEAYDEFYEAMAPSANGRVIGLVFPRKGIQHGLIICDEGLDGIPYRGLTWLYTGMPEKKGKKRGVQHQLFVRPYQTLIEAIHNKGHGWCMTE